ncbi:hypothetical protein O988_09184 [Pseudogymnoascus sp. VKM F-3808]|nr:hypothetical protein O988_09184 [Pseudogymnoascus sp. VKM F-3808]
MATEFTPSASDLRFAPPGFTTHTCTTPTGTKLSFRLWAASPPPTSPAPFITYTHGGRWEAGNHFAPLPWLFPGFQARGYHLISHNYRLGPQAPIDAQLADCIAAVEWCRVELPRILGADKVDVDRYIIAGESAGGHLVALMAHHLVPSPRAVINAYGPVDLAVLMPFSGPVPTSPPETPWTGEFSEQELLAYLSDRTPENVLMDALWWDEDILFPAKLLSERWAADIEYSPRIKLQAEFHRWGSTIGAGPALRISMFHDERFKDEEALCQFMASMSPSAMLLEMEERKYPPMAFLHGTADDLVGVEQSRCMAERLRGLGVSVLESYEEGVGHIFDKKYTGPDVEGWDKYIRPILEFCDELVA